MIFQLYYMASVYALKIDSELNEDLYQILINKTSTDKRNKIQKFARRDDKLRCLYADLLTRYILIRYLGFKNDAISFIYSSYGKPFIDGLKDVHFNISHSGEWVVCAIDEKPVGIDIEYIAPVNLEIAETYFSNSEKEQLFALKQSEQLHFFYELWTFKESYLKLIGEGLSAPLDSFSISIDQGKNVVLKSSTEAPATFFFKQYNLDIQYMMAACALSDAFENVALLSMQEINVFFSDAMGSIYSGGR